MNEADSYMKERNDLFVVNALDSALKVLFS